MKSKQLFDDLEEEKIKPTIKKKAPGKVKKISDKTNQKENKIKKKVKGNDCSDNNISSDSSSRNNNKNKSVKKDTKSIKGIPEYNGDSKQKSRKTKKDESPKPSELSKNDKKSSRKPKDKNDRSRKHTEEPSRTSSESPTETKKRSELIEDYKKWNAPDEYLIGKINPRTNRPYEQLSCCKRGWTYIDVDDIDWLKKHLGSK